MDRNQVIGFSLLAALLIAYIAYNNHSQKEFEKQKRADSVAAAKVHPKPIIKDTVAVLNKVADVVNDSIKEHLPPAYKGEASTVVLENKRIKLSFTTKGAFPVAAEVKGFKTFDQKPLYLFNSNSNQLSAILPVANGTASTADLFFTPAQQQDPKGGQKLSFSADLGDGKGVTITYSLPADDYMLHYDIALTGMAATELAYNWTTHSIHTERDVAAERLNSQVYYRFMDEEHDYFTITDEKKEALDKKTNWVGLRMQFFSTALISKTGFNNTNIDATSKLPDSNIIAKTKTSFTLPLTANAASLDWYIGPNHYQTLRQYKIGLDNMVPLGYGVMAFVKYINKWLIIPIFNVLSKFISNYGVIIMLMTIIIRLLLSFFTYKSYLSSAKMRVLKPELDALRAKLGDDQQKFGVEQMKLYKTAGVNPLGGCLPTLLQLPILFAMYYFFPSSIELRQESFLWASDLSTYDSIASWTTQIPVLSSIYGNHVSLFTILMTASSLFLALYNRNMTPQDPNNPMMKWLPYIFPFLLIGVFNKMAAALTFYYFFSNMISIAQQFIIQKFFIDEKKIHAQIQENKNKPATASKWAQKMEEMQKSQAQRTQQQGKLKK